MKTFIIDINRVLKKSKLTQTELAKALGVSNSVVSDLKNNRRSKVDLDIIYSIYALYNIPVSKLLVVGDIDENVRYYPARYNKEIK